MKPDQSGGADLHLHTIFSDGTDSPALLVEKAISKRFKAIAVTDHDTAGGVEPARQAAGDRIEIISGVEFSVEVDDGELHILGLFLDDADPALQEKLREFGCRRRNRIHEMTDRLRRIGVDISAEEIFRRAGRGSPGRVHIAQALVEKNYVKNTSAAFSRLIGRGGPAFVNKVRPTPAETIEIIRAAGGVAVYAHPGLTKRDDMIQSLVESGLQGIEAISPAHSPGETERYIKLAGEFGLQVSAGSDSHGIHRDRELIGLVRLDEERLEALRGASRA